MAICDNLGNGGSQSEWKLAGKVTGTTPIALPDNYSELLIYLHPGTTVIRGCVHILRDYLSENEVNYGIICGASTNGGLRRGTIEATLETITLQSVYTSDNGNDLSSSSTIAVYYR